jgi:hypothetical protein
MAQLFGANADYIFIKKNGQPLNEDILEKLYNLVNTFQFPASLTDFNQAHISTLSSETQDLLKTNEYDFFKKMIDENFFEEDILIVSIPKTLSQFSWFVKSLKVPPFPYVDYYSFKGDRTLEEREKAESEEKMEKIDELRKKIIELENKINQKEKYFNSSVDSLTAGLIEDIEYLNESNLITDKEYQWFKEKKYQDLSGDAEIPEYLSKGVKRELIRYFKYINDAKERKIKRISELKNQISGLTKNIESYEIIYSRGNSSISDYNLSFISDVDKFKIWKNFNAVFVEFIMNFEVEINEGISPENEQYLRNLTHYILNKIQEEYKSIDKKYDYPYDFRRVMFLHEKTHFDFLTKVIEHELDTMFLGNLHTIYSATSLELAKKLGNTDPDKGISYSDGYFAAPFFDNINGMAASYLNQCKYLDIVDLNKSELLTLSEETPDKKLFFIPPIINCFRMLGHGEYHHPRSKISKDTGLLWLKDSRQVPNGMKTGVGNLYHSQDMVSSVQTKEELKTLFDENIRHKIENKLFSQI